MNKAINTLWKYTFRPSNRKMKTSLNKRSFGSLSFIEHVSIPRFQFLFTYASPMAVQNCFDFWVLIILPLGWYFHYTSSSEFVEKFCCFILNNCRAFWTKRYITFFFWKFDYPLLLLWKIDHLLKIICWPLSYTKIEKDLAGLNFKFTWEQDHAFD